MNGDEMKRVLTMLEEGKINADEAGRLIEAIRTAETAPSQPANGKGKTLHVRVYNRGSDKPKVNVNIPLGIAKWAMGFIPADARARMAEKDIDADEILAHLSTNPGEVITVDDEEDNQRVEIFIR